MNIITEEQKDKLLDNGHDDHRDQDHAPVVRLFFPGTRCVWLLNEIVPDEPHIAFGLCDLGMGFPELGYVSLTDLAAVNIRDMTVLRDDTFVSRYPMSVYAEAARGLREITDDTSVLERAKAALANKRQPRPE